MEPAVLAFRFHPATQASLGSMSLSDRPQPGRSSSGGARLSTLLGKWEVLIYVGYGGTDGIGQCYATAQVTAP